MARKKVIREEEPKEVQLPPCGDCAKAYGYCMPGADRSPIGCRCPKHPGEVIFCSRRSCGDFELRKEAAPKVVEVFLSEDLFVDRSVEKVVPLFREGELRPWKLVPASKVPPGGISWTGEGL